MLTPATVPLLSVIRFIKAAVLGDDGFHQQLLFVYSDPQSQVRSAIPGGACGSDGAPGVEHAERWATLRPRRRDKPLGLGAGVTLLAPYVLAVVTSVMTYTEVVWPNPERAAASTRTGP